LDPRALVALLAGILLILLGVNLVQRPPTLYGTLSGTLIIISLAFMFVGLLFVVFALWFDLS
jgi:hypothetical protein